MVFVWIRDIFIAFHYLLLFFLSGGGSCLRGSPPGGLEDLLGLFFGGDWVLYYAIASELHASVFSRE